MPRSTSVIGMQRADRRRSIDDNAAIHLLLGDPSPLSADANFGPLVRRAVEPLGKGGGNVRVNRRAVGERNRHGAVIGDLRDDLGQFSG